MADVPPLPSTLVPYPVIADIAFAEGLIFDDAGNLYFVNYKELGTLGRMTPDGTVSVWAHTGGQINGLKYDGRGHIVGADHMGNRITRFDILTREMEVLTDNFEGKEYVGPNDICMDLKGNIYFSESGKDEQVANGGVYRIEMDDGNMPVRVVQPGDQMPFPNGLAVHPDKKRFFVALSGETRSSHMSSGPAVS